MAKTQAVVGKTNMLKHGEMKQVGAGDTEILLVRLDDTYHALGAHCPHYHAPLADGLLHDGRVICPWHHACFDARSGALLEPPARDALARYEVEIKGDDIVVSLPEGAAEQVEPQMCRPDWGADPRTFLIAGAGAAANAAAQSLREHGFAGRIVMVGPESQLPYDRPNLSKDYLAGNAQPEWMPLRDPAFYEKYGIEHISGTKITSLDGDANTAELEDGSKVPFDRALIATGSAARRLVVPGNGLRNIFTLRAFDDADAIIAALDGAKKAVVIGASFIAMEGADSLAQRGMHVTVAAPEAVPFERVLGPELGAHLQARLEKRGVQFRMGVGIKAFDGDSSVETVELDDGSVLPADLVLVGIGVDPDAEFTSLANTDGSVDVDENLRAAADIFAAGDIARYPDARSGERQRIEHWRVAEQQGRVAAMNMLDQDVAFTQVPFFWTNIAGLSVDYMGHAEDWEESILTGDIESGSFIIFYVRDGRTLAAAGAGASRELAAIEELLRLNRMPDAAAIRAAGTDVASLLFSRLIS